MKILVFTEGTATKHPSQEHFFDVASFVPTEGTVEKLTMWRAQGAEISYLTSQRWNDNPQAVEATLRRFNFPAGELYYRREGEDYVDVVRRVCPEVLIEDDCRSIGWEEVITPKLKAEWGIKGIIVQEFGGLAQLPDGHQELLRMAS
ncbi:MAG: hypothetical protein Q8P22_09555 [Chloroflexota bacterium]|nr:hypothetical protein [Chloroflexota bacterium]